jgi:hypothetical protein
MTQAESDHVRLQPLSIVILTEGKEPLAKPVRGADRYGGAAEYFAR